MVLSQSITVNWHEALTDGSRLCSLSCDWEAGDSGRYAAILMLVIGDEEHVRAAMPRARPEIEALQRGHRPQRGAESGHAVGPEAV